MPLCNYTEPAKENLVAVIDIGSNSVRLVFFSVFGNASTPVYNEKVFAGLGKDLYKTGKLSPEGMKTTLLTLKRFKLLVETQNPEKILIAATAALRDASDADLFITCVEQEIGFSIAPLSGSQEAHYSALGVVAGDQRAHGVAADLGGASLELTQIAHGKPLTGKTYPLGPFSVYDDIFDPNTCRVFIENHLNVDFPDSPNLYLIGGAWRNLALIHQIRNQYPLRIAHNYQLTPSQTRALALWTYKDGMKVVSKWPGVNRRRAETLPYSGVLLDVMLEKIDPEKVLIAPGGLREGLLLASTDTRMRKVPPLLDACRHLALGSEQGVNFGQPLYRFLKDFSKSFPGAFDPENENRLRAAGCVLVGIGKGLHPERRAELVFETVLYAPVPGLTHRERVYLALMVFASYTFKRSPPNRTAIDLLLSDEEQTRARAFGAAMRLGVALTGRAGDLLSKLSLRINDNCLILSVKPEYENLISSRGRARLERLSELTGMSAEVMKSDP